MSEPPADEPPAEDMDFGRAPEHSALQRLKTDFAGWHHPRKQHVRIQQWCAAARSLIRETGLDAAHPFRYLTLPGDELLDVRALHGVCEREGVPLRYVGFNSAQGEGQAELNISRSEVQALAAVDPFSVVVLDRLEAVANPRSQGFKRAKAGAPFHAINIDLCDSLAFRDADDGRGSVLGALAKLLELQLQTTTPWLLFITTLARPGLVSDRSKEGFSSALAANTAASEAFKTELAQLVSGSADALDALLEAAWQRQDPDFLRLFCAGLGKWLIRLLAEVPQPRELTLLSSYYYQVGPDGPDMVSLAFRCTTPVVAVADRDGILPAAPTASSFSEVDVALRLAREVAGLVDLDHLIASDSGLAERLIRQAGDLLETARFDRPSYEAWAAAVLESRGTG